MALIPTEVPPPNPTLLKLHPQKFGDSTPTHVLYLSYIPKIASLPHNDTVCCHLCNYIMVYIGKETGFVKAFIMFEMLQIVINRNN